MRSFGGLGTFVILLSSLLFLTRAWSSELASRQLPPGAQRGVEAIVTRVGPKSLTLKPTDNLDMELIVPRTDDGTLRVGDRVVLSGKELRKVGDEEAKDDVGKNAGQPGPMPLKGYGS
ncbi:MAG TPA: hypothetical protein PLI53_09855 [Geobacteraceae bacterium]|nr:hypothetical protein [Geobacteraceae bacterium]